jgi:membrane-bound metal-dependent hydrolase YbcI (DUF457 family)
MWPREHLALGYLIALLLWRLDRRLRDGRIAVFVAPGTQFPDVVDKTMAWYLDVLPGARSLAHSLFVAGPTCVGLLVLAYVFRGGGRHRVATAFAFAVGYTSHLFGDALPKVLQGQYDHLTFLLWPLLPAPPDPGMGPILANFREIVASPVVFLATGSYRTMILGAVVVVWMADGSPGVADVGRYLVRTVRAEPGD